MSLTQSRRAHKSPEQKSTGSRLVMIAMILAVSMTFIDQTIVAIASPTIQGDLHLTASQGQWVINAYLVALAATFALGGRLADVWGRRRMLLVGVVGFAATSALCGATPDNGWAETWLIAARAGQGVFAAVLMPAAIAIVYSSAPAAKRGSSMAMFFGLTGAFTALGPILGDYLLHYSWRAIFWVNIPVAVAAVIVVLAARIPETQTPGRIDWRGAALVATGMALSVLGFSESATWGWSSTGTISCLVLGVVFLAAFVVVELRTAEPLVKLNIFRARGFRVDSAVLFLAMIGFVPVSYFLSMYAHISLGMDATEATHLLLFFFVGYFVAAQLGGRIFDSRGAKLTILLGCAISAAGFVWWATQVTHLDASAQHWPLLVAGAGVGLLLGPSSADAVSRAHDASYGEVTGINQTVRNYGSALGFAVLGTVLANVFTSRFTQSLVDLGTPRSTAEQVAAHASSGAGATSGSLSQLPARMQAAVEHAAAHDFALGMQAVLIGMAAALVLALLVALLHPGDRPAQDA